jgi:predicted O-methyltransferase YrrM
MPEQRRREIPAVVSRAEELCRRLGFEHSCRAETGYLLQTLAATAVTGKVLELGTGGGYGTAWLASALRPGGAVRLITVDLNAGLSSEVAQLFAGWPQVDVLAGDWRVALGHAPFALIFVDASDAKASGIDDVVASLATGGLVLLDDLTPLELWPDEWRGKPDPIRDAWLHHPGLMSAELRVATDHAAILGVRR